MNVTPEISVIVPVYNVEKYLRQCVDSVLNQTFRNFELILVDDGSSDSSGMICDEYANEDARIRVIHKKNGGVSCARNDGINHSRGEYIMFIDSDDYIENTMLEETLHAILENDVDLVAGGLTFFFENEGKYVSYITKEGIVSIDYDINDSFEALIKNYTFAAIYSKVYKKSIIDKYHISFDSKYSILEDGMFVIDYILHSKKIYCTGSALYFYRKFDGDSLMKKYNENAIEAWEQYFQKFLPLVRYLSEPNRLLVSRLFEDYFIGFMGQIYSRSNQNSRKKYTVLKKYMNTVAKYDFSWAASATHGIKHRVIRYCVKRKMTLFLHIYFAARNR